MAKSKAYGMSERQKYLEQKKRNSPSDKSKGESAWLKVRRRVRRKLWDR